MKKKVCFGVVLACLCSGLCSNGATSKEGTAIKSHSSQTVKIEKLDKTKVLSPMMQANIKEYIELKKNLGVDDPELSRTDCLELIALAYAKLFDNLETRVSNLELRTHLLENSVSSLRMETTALKGRTEELDADLSKLYDWSNRIDDEMHSESCPNGVAFKIKQLRTSVASDLEAHSCAINNHAGLIQSVQDGVNRNGADISRLYGIINSFR